MKLKPSKFALQAGVSKQAVSAKIKNGTLVVDAAGFLDTDNPINSAYISDPGRKPKKAASLPFPAATAPTGACGVENPNETDAATKTILGEMDIMAVAGVPAGELLDYTLRDLVTRFNGIYNLEKHARTLQNLVTAADKEQRMAERALRLIPKDFVASRVFPFLDSLAKKLIEYPESESDNIVTKIIADGPGAREAIIEMMQNGLSRVIAGSKEQIVKELNSLRGRHSVGEAIPENGGYDDTAVQ